MDVKELALYKLALKGILTIEEARVLKTLFRIRSAGETVISRETNLQNQELQKALQRLESRKVISNRDGIYFCENRAEKLFELVNCVEMQLAMAR